LRTWIILRRSALSETMLMRPADADGNGLWLVGMLALVLAAAWRHGADLQQQSDLTV
jgi:MYXO-CTERM domain-containing protein